MIFMITRSEFFTRRSPGGSSCQQLQQHCHFYNYHWSINWPQFVASICYCDVWSQVGNRAYFLILLFLPSTPPSTSHPFLSFYICRTVLVSSFRTLTDTWSAWGVRVYYMTLREETLPPLPPPPVATPTVAPTATVSPTQVLSPASASHFLVIPALVLGIFLFLFV